MNDFLRNYILTIIDKMINSNREDDYKIMNYALGWYEKDVLVQADLEAVQELIAAKNNEATEETAEESAEEIEVGG